MQEAGITNDGLRLSAFNVSQRTDEWWVAAYSSSKADVQLTPVMCLLSIESQES